MQKHLPIRKLSAFTVPRFKSKSKSNISQKSMKLTKNVNNIIDNSRYREFHHDDMIKEFEQSFDNGYRCQRYY